MTPHRERPGVGTGALTDPPPSKSLPRSLPEQRPDVRELVEHLTQMQRRVVQDAFSEARASYWRRRAAAFRAALPRQDEWHGREGLASVRMRRDRLKAIIAACESAAEVALWQDAEDDLSGAVR